MKKKILAVLFAVTAMAVAGCGSNTTATTATPTPATEAVTTETETVTEAEAATETAAEEKVTDTRKVVVVTAGTGEPYSLLADDGSWTGIDAEMWDEIAKRTGWEIEVKQAAFDAIWGELDTQRADVSANCWAVRPEREEKYNASIPYYGDAQCVIVASDNEDIYEFADLKGKTVGCTNGQAAQKIITEMADEIGFTVTLYEDSAIGMTDLSMGRVDAYANTTTNVNNYTHYNENVTFRFLEEDLTANNVAYFLPKTDEGKELCDELNVVLQEMLDDGTIAAITEKWMYADMTKLIQ